MSRFFLETNIPISKSVANRYLMICYYSKKKLNDEVLDLCASQDVKDLFNLLSDFEENKKYFKVGEGGAVLRFFIPLLFRAKGEFSLELGSSLRSRPNNELISLAEQMNADLSFTHSGIRLRADAFSGGIVSVDVSESSQYLSGLLLNSWNLEKDLVIEKLGDQVSSPYLEMTMKFLRDSGLNIKEAGSQIIVKAGQIPMDVNVKLEADISSAFALAAIASLGGSLLVKNFPSKSTQADFIFVEILEKMGVSIFNSASGLKVESSRLELKGINWNIKDCPDLFPVLASLLAFSKEESRLFGAEHLAAKESNRLEAVSEHLIQIGRKHELQKDGIYFPAMSTQLKIKEEVLKLSTFKDHRMAFAAGLFIAAGFTIELDQEEVVNKSFSSYWALLKKGGVDAVPHSWT